MRVWFMIELVVVTGTAIALLVAAAHTESFFAWTINPPVSAAFIGASFGGAVPMLWLASRRQNWADARIAVYGVWVFTTVTLIATLLHLDQFHLNDGGPLARLSAWVWLGLYVVVPIGLPVLVALQLRVPGGEPPRRMIQPPWFRVTVGVLAAAAAVTGVVLFVAPGQLAWPWQLGPLTSQAIGAWLVGTAVLLAQVAYENDWQRVRIALVAMVALGVLNLVVLLAYAGDIEWGKPLAAALVVFALGLIAAGGWGWSASRRAATIRTIAG